LSHDQYENQKKEYDYSDYGKEFQTRVEFYKEITPVFEVTRPLELIIVGVAAIDSAYGNQNILTEMIRFLVNKHPVASRAERFLGSASNPYSTRSFFSIPGFELIKRYDPRMYVGKDGKKPFQDLDVTLKSLKMKGFEEFTFFIKDQKKTFNFNSKL